MANTRGSANVRSYMYPGRHALLPPKSPFPSVSSSYADHIQSPAVGPKVMQKSKDGAHHQRTSSESFLVEEQPSWLDDLLDEPETPVCRQGHRRSSSDSFAYLEAPSLYHVDFGTQDNCMNMTGTPPFWGSQEFDNYNGVQHASLYAEANFSKQKNRVFPSGLPSLRDNKIGHSSASLAAAKEAGNVPSANVNEKKLDITDTCSHVPQASSEKNESSHVKSETDTKRAKQQFAQRSRVRKLQYIAELEKNVQALQAEGSEVSAEVEFLNQQTLILSMENKALKQRLENIAQEQLIKYMEHEVLERELARLRALYQQQLQQPQPQQRQQQPQQRGSSSHRRSGSKELDSQFANLSLRAKDFNTSHGPVTGPLHL